MKINKLLIGLAAVMLGTFTACNTDVEGEYYKSNFENISFDAATQSVTVTVDQSSTTIPVRLTRSNTANAFTAHYTTTASQDGIFTDGGNGTVEFAAGEGTAIVNITANNLEKEVAYTYKLELAEADVATADTITNNQITAITLTVTREGDWTEWKKWNAAGTATYVYVNFWEGEDPELPFVYRQNMSAPDNYQFKISHWGGDVDLTVNYNKASGHVTVPVTFTGYTHSSYGDVYVADLATYAAEVRGWDVDESYYGVFDEEQAIFAIPLVYFVSAGYFGYDPEYIYIDGVVRADYSSALEFRGVFTNIAQEVFAVGDLTLGADAKTVKAVIVEADADAEAVADAILAGDLEATDVEGGTIYVPIPEDMTGKLQIVVAVIADEEVKSVASANFEYYGGGANPWQSIGKGYLLDNFIITMYWADSSTQTPWTPQMYEVEIEESTETPGLYRVVNAFAGVADLISVGYTPTPLEVNATNPNTVYILPQFSGVTDADGDISIATYGGYLLTRYSMSDLDPRYFGQLSEGVILFPSFYSSDKSYTFQGLFIQGTSAYYTGYDATEEEQFAIILPNANAPKLAKAKKMAKATAFANRLKAAHKINMEVLDKQLLPKKSKKQKNVMPKVQMIRK